MALESMEIRSAKDAITEESTAAKTIDCISGTFVPGNALPKATRVVKANRKIAARVSFRFENIDPDTSMFMEAVFQ